MDNLESSGRAALKVIEDVDSDIDDAGDAPGSAQPDSQNKHNDEQPDPRDDHDGDFVIEDAYDIEYICRVIPFEQ
ncbi:MAG: hypothetical protein MHM6MM_007060 [Cercozoa sp. M6MM]